MELFKLFVIQILFASLPVLLVSPFESFIRKRFAESMSGRQREAVGLAFTLACASSILLCWLLDIGSARIDGELSLVPAAAGILYGARRTGLWIAAFYGLLGFAFTGSLITGNLWMEILLLLLLVPFRSALMGLPPVRRRLLFGCWVMAAYLPHQPLHAQAALLAGDSLPMQTGRTLIELAAAGLSGMLLLYSRKSAVDRYERDEQAGEMRERFIEEETKLQALMRSLPGFALTLDRSYRITDLNDQALTVMQQRGHPVTKDMVVGFRFEELMTRIGAAADPEVLRALEQAGSQNRTIERMISFNGRRFHFYASPAHTQQGGLMGTVCSLYEVTEADRMRAELENMNRLSMIGQLAAGVTHEIRNPMAVVRGYLQLLQHKTPSEFSHYYTIVLEELDRAAGIIDDFLSLARTKPELSDVRTLPSVIEEIQPLLLADANLRGQTLTMQFDDSSTAIPMNPREIKQLVLNLGRNAMEAMGNKGELTIRTEEIGSKVVLRVRDNGPGMPEEVLRRVQEPFFTTKKEGTGLGLPLCSGIAERHGGRMYISSRADEGTEVCIEFAKTAAASDSVHQT
ncbi:ATP-binding protein [Saccharibacillus sp. CPCC 101409]|uniref:two-component system sensor histidine kinase NtrB n=1 Tax=Saccharibacillus sp. CPCC 101409 TaxID=3058041 RepID=UPI0026737A68|nr:ATP-binding protein [Saccharibacillus sp. CPCC 101409]MDO3412642.1 ATP-binding protein [Saccharibacillus sp. CPCC 101409]